MTQVDGRRIASTAFPDSDVVFAFEAADVDTGDRFDVMRCPDTGSGFTHPIPANLDRYYPEGYRRFHPIIERIMRRRYRSYARQVTSRLGGHARVLEVGCGSGWMLQAFSDLGWDAVGLERTDRIAAQVSEATGLRILSGRLEDVEGAGSFDLVVLYNVLEHLPDPRAVLGTIHGLLRTRGSLTVTVPNFASWQARVTTAGWFHLDVPRHLHHFTPSGLKALLMDAGFAPGRERNVSMALDVFGWVQSLENLWFVERNLLHRTLSNSSPPTFASLSRAGLLLALSGVLACGAFGAAVGSWPLRKGALMEVWARKDARVPGA